MRIPFPILIVAFFACTIPFAPPEARGGQKGMEALHNSKGFEYFKEAFYQSLPKGQQREADRAFDLAAAEFQAAIALKPDFVEAHRNLARLYFVRKQFAKAAESYVKVTHLAPRDLDAYVQAALAYIELNRSYEAIRQLELAKAQSDDEEATRRLEGYIQKIRERK